jgi:hypothetical protein
MKKYLLFYGNTFYPGGGFDDFIGEYDSIQECLLALYENFKKEGIEDNPEYYKEFRWSHAYDTISKEKISLMYE